MNEQAICNTPENEGRPYPCGHGFCLDRDGGRVAVKAGVTFVDAAQEGKEGQDGTAEHPFARIRDAVEQAGENSVIYVRSGRYVEAVALRPGQTLTSVVELEGLPAGSEWREADPPLLEPEAGDLVSRRVWEKKTLGAVLVLPENTRVRGLEIRVADGAAEDGAEEAVDEERVRATVDDVLRRMGRTEVGEEERRALEKLTRNALRKMAGEKKNEHDEIAAIAAMPSEEAGDHAVGVHDCALRATGKARGLVLHLPKRASLGEFRMTGASVSAEAGKGITISLDKRTRTRIELTGNTVATTEAEAFAVNIVAEKKATLNLEARGNRLDTQGQEADALRVTLSGKEATLTGEIRNNRIRARGGRADGVLVNADGEARVAELLVAENDIAVSGDRAKGVNIWASDRGTQERLALRDNTVATEGGFAVGLHVEAAGSPVRLLEARGNTVTAESAQGVGLNVMGSGKGGVVENCILRGNRVEARPHGIRVAFREDAALNLLECRENSVRTKNGQSPALSLGASERGRLGRAVVSGNDLATEGDRADAVWVRVSEDGTLDDLELADNTLSTGGERAQGVSMSAQEKARAGRFVLTGNTIATRGDGADAAAAAAIKKGVLAALRLSGNTLSTGGDEADAVWVGLHEGGALDDLDLADNTLSTRGDEARGVNLVLPEGRLGKTALTGNRIATEGDEAHGMAWRIDGETTLDGPPLVRDNAIEIRGDDAHGLCLRGEGRRAAKPGLTGAAAANAVRIGGDDGEPVFIEGGEDEDGDDDGWALPERRSGDGPSGGETASELPDEW